MTYRELAEQWRKSRQDQDVRRVEVAESLENQGPEDARISAIRGRFLKAELRRTAEGQTGRGRNASK